jgi:hypothetical protein
MNEPHPTNSTIDSEKQSKAYCIRQLRKNNPKMKGYEIAEKARTTTAYVYNVLSKAKRRSEVERRREDRLFGTVHGGVCYRDVVLPEWYDCLRVPIVNSRTGMKQVGFLKNGDLCSCQVHKNGRVVVFPHALGWKEWLKEDLVRHGWDEGKASLLVDNLTIQVVLAEAGVKVHDGFLPKDILLKTSWGMAIVRDDSPTKNMLEVKLSVPDLNRYLGLPEFRNKLDLLVKGSMTANQLLRALITLLLKERKP